MPGGDRTGPAGLGPMTGRAAGYCSGYSAPGYANPVPGRGAGFGRGWGWGFGWRRAGYPYRAYQGYGTSYPERMPTGREVDVLEEQAEALESELNRIKKRLKELKSKELK